jgi:hypothetical protein
MCVCWSSPIRWRRSCLYLTGILLPLFLLTACSGLALGGGSDSTPTPRATLQSAQQVALTQLHWCNKPVTIFRDEGAPAATTPTAGTTPTRSGTPTPGSTPTATDSPVANAPKTLTDWAQVEPNLGFTVYLPATLPPTACLVSTIGTIHDPILGGSFVITYMLADHSSISLSEAPLRTQSLALQCSPSTVSTGSPASASTTPGPTPNPTHAPTRLCTGVRDTTNIVFSAQGDTATLEQFFNALQPNVNWVPAS